MQPAPRQVFIGNELHAFEYIKDIKSALPRNDDNFFIIIATFSKCTHGYCNLEIILGNFNLIGNSCAGCSQVVSKVVVGVGGCAHPAVCALLAEIGRGW